MRSRAAFNHRLRHRIVLESQLLSEEKWIINNLKKIKKIRNSLQIERLQLESLKTKLTQNTNKSQKPSVAPTTSSEANATTSTAEKIGQQARSSRSSIQFEVPLVSQETSCNDEELDLAVTSSVFNQSINNNSMEEYEEEEEEDCDSLVIDMNMFMNGICEVEKKQAKE